MSNPRPPREDPDPYAQRVRYEITCRIFASPNNEVGRTSYVRYGASSLGTLCAHLAYINAAFPIIDIYVTTRDRPESEPRTDPLSAV